MQQLTKCPGEAGVPTHGRTWTSSCWCPWPKYHTYRHVCAHPYRQFWTANRQLFSEATSVMGKAFRIAEFSFSDCWTLRSTLPAIWLSNIVKLHLASTVQGLDVLKQMKHGTTNPQSNPWQSLRECHLMGKNFAASLKNCKVSKLLSRDVFRIIFTQLESRTSVVRELGEGLESHSVTLVIRDDDGSTMSWREWVKAQVLWFTG